MRRGTRYMMMRSTYQGGEGGSYGARNDYGNMRGNEMRNDGRWMPPYYEGGAESNMNYGESRFRDRRGREHYDNGRFAPMRGEMGEGGNMEARQTYNVSNNNGRVVDFGAEYGRRAPQSRQIGFERMENANMAYMGGGSKGGMMQMGGAQGYSEGMDMETAKEWTKHMKNEDGTKGPHWSMEQVKQLVNQRKLDVDEVEFFAVLNAMYSDYCKVAKKHNVNNMDFYVDLAMAWLQDEDAVPDKAMMYYECIVK